jgi:hypothetical protein
VLPARSESKYELAQRRILVPTHCQFHVAKASKRVMAVPHPASMPKPLAAGNRRLREQPTGLPRGTVQSRDHARVSGTRPDVHNFSSFQAKRSVSTMATDFIEHLSSILAIPIENVINNSRLKHIDPTKPLTGVNNRCCLEWWLPEEIGRTHRQGHGLACAYNRYRPLQADQLQDEGIRSAMKYRTKWRRASRRSCEWAVRSNGAAAKNSWCC